MTCSSRSTTTWPPRRATPRCSPVVDSGIIGLALLAAIVLALMVSRLLLNPIRRVRSGALEVAHVRLPEAVERIRAGQEPGEFVPIGVTTHEETGQLARAVDDLHRQAVKLASGEAALREQVGDMFVTLSRRNTSLINQQLGLIETLESDEEDPQRLESLFRLDHLAARMRRNAESLVILSGAPTRATEQDDLSLDRRPPGRDRRGPGLPPGTARRGARPAGHRRGLRGRRAPARRAGRQRPVLLPAELEGAGDVARSPAVESSSRSPTPGSASPTTRSASSTRSCAPVARSRPTPHAGWACSWSAGLPSATASRSPWTRTTGWASPPRSSCPRPS